jgi:hypothetical protein
MPRQLWSELKKDIIASALIMQMKRKAEPNLPTPIEHPKKKQRVVFTTISPKEEECGPKSMSFTPCVDKRRIRSGDYITRAITPPIHSDEYPHFPLLAPSHIIHVRAATQDPRVLALSLLTYMKDLWNTVKDMAEDVGRFTSHVVHESLAFKKEKEDTVVVTSWCGGPDFLWKRLVKSKGGGSITAAEHSTLCLKPSNIFIHIQQEVGKRVASSVEGAPIVSFKCGHHLIIENEADQMLLQETGLMSERQFADFNCILVDLTGMSIHTSKTVLSSLQDGKTPDHTITMTSLIVNHTLQDRHVFWLDRMSQVIEMQVFKLMYHKGAFRVTSEKTGLADNNIIVRFGGDKGGKKMAFKFWATVINCVRVNQTETFDLISTMEAFDTYYNLKHGVFKH